PERPRTPAGGRGTAGAGSGAVPGGGAGEAALCRSQAQPHGSDRAARTDGHDARTVEGLRGLGAAALPLAEALEVANHLLVARVLRYRLPRQVDGPRPVVPCRSKARVAL